MRLVFEWINHLRTLTPKNMSAFAAAVVAQFEAVIATANLWAATDHNDDGTHKVIRLSTEATPAATSASLTIWFDGTNLKVKFPNGTTGTVTIV